MSDRKDQRPVMGKSMRQKDSAFDLWLTRGLHQLFDDVASEPVPDELIRLIEGNFKEH